MANRTVEEFEDAIGVLAQGQINLETVVQAQGELIKAQGEIIRAMDLKIRLQQTLIDNHHDVFIKAGLATPRPTEDPLVH
jgi:hypothetical protein